MQITHLGHSAVLVEVDGRRILIDPGNFSDEWHGLTDLDVILVTHLHPDHVDPEHAPALVRANPRARVLVEPTVPDVVPLDRAELISADTSVDLGGVRVAAVGGLHAVIHKDIPRIGNVGLVISAEGEPTLFHPGDSLAAIPSGVDVLAVPAYGPWAAMKETVDFAREVAAPIGFCIHDGLLNERGWSLVFNRVTDMTPCTLVDLRGKGPWTPGDGS
ncbi:MAG: MBL fold metallo-hydrolase [Propionibacteriaceae bacterium]|nr:MBL fold metallo-hydrolase [Propionibacteriaceae bacterium]